MAAAYESKEALLQYHDFHENYYDYGALDEESRTRADFLSALMLLERDLPENKRTILDVGYGNGFFLALARERGWVVTGIDTSPTNKEMARKKFGLDLHVGSVEDLTTESKKYDAVTAWDVMEHLSAPHEMVQAFSRILVPGGMALIAVPNDHSFLRDLSEWSYVMSGGHFRAGIEKCYFLEHVGYFNINSLRDLFKKHDFSLRGHFFSSTDLEKYKFSFTEKMLARMILLCGRLLSRQNRLVAVFQKNVKGDGSHEGFGLPSHLQ